MKQGQESRPEVGTIQFANSSDHLSMLVKVLGVMYYLDHPGFLTLETIASGPLASLFCPTPPPPVFFDDLVAMLEFVTGFNVDCVIAREPHDPKLTLLYIYEHYVWSGVESHFFLALRSSVFIHLADHAFEAVTRYLSQLPDTLSAHVEILEDLVLPFYHMGENQVPQGKNASLILDNMLQTYNDKILYLPPPHRFEHAKRKEWLQTVVQKRTYKYGHVLPTDFCIPALELRRLSKGKELFMS